jgi:hypothetical protein
MRVAVSNNNYQAFNPVIAKAGQQSIGSAVTSVQPRGPTESIDIYGDDTIYINSTLGAAEAAPGTILAKIPIDPSIAPRLRGHAALYQNIRYNSLLAYINGQASSLTTGSMILAFCADPADDIPSDSISWGRSQKCNGSGKYWETIAVKIPHKQMIGPFGGAFKNNAGDSTNERTYSPGFLALVAVSPPSQVTPVEVMLRWDVTLSGPTMNEEVNLGPSSVESLVNFGMLGNATADSPVDWELQVFAPGVQNRDLTKSDFSPPLEADTFYELPGGQLVIAGNTGASGAPEYAEATHIGLKADKVVFYRYQISTDTFVEAGGLTAKPTPTGAPSFRKGTFWRIDPESPSRIISDEQLGFRNRSIPLFRLTRSSGRN